MDKLELISGFENGFHCYKLNIVSANFSQIDLSKVFLILNIHPLIDKLTFDIHWWSLGGLQLCLPKMFIWTGYTIISRYPTTTERGPNYKSLTDSVTILSQGLEFYSTRSIFLHILPSHRHLMLQRFFGTIFILLKSC